MNQVSQRKIDSNFLLYTSLPARISFNCIFMKSEVAEMEIAPHITVDSRTHHGAPVITGTRVPVSIVIGSLAGGMDKEEVMREYELTREEVEAALVYAADLVAKTGVVSLEGS
jgi:uncharacterized protein (DUF433 family)